jgi:arylsulfatase A
MGRKGCATGSAREGGEEKEGMNDVDVYMDASEVARLDPKPPLVTPPKSRGLEVKPRHLRVATALVALIALAAFATAAPASRTNIILILADDLGWADLSCYGNTFNETPNIDRLASQGVRFTQFYAGPVCSPTRASIQSGQNQARLGITVHIPGHWRPFAKMVEPPVALNLPLEIETFAERLGAAGYQTGYFGKWHLGEAGFGPAEQGWKTAIETQGNVVPPRVAPDNPPRRTAEFLTEKAIGFIEANKDRPFLLQVSHFAVHIPLSTRPDLAKKYEARKPMPNYPSRADYAGLLEELDESVGKIVGTVDRLGLGANTLIVFVSDNGGLHREQGGTITTSNAPLRSEKGTLYEGGIRVPCIARWTGTIPSSRESAAIASTIDFYPTFLDVAAQSVGPHTQTLDGVTLLPLLRNPSASLNRDTLYWHLPHYHHSTPASAIRRGDWKLIEFFEDGKLELYHLRDDLSEANDVSANFPDQTKALHAALKTWRRDVQAQLPQRNPGYDPGRADEFWSRKTITPTRAPGGGRDGEGEAGAPKKARKKQ